MKIKSYIFLIVLFVILVFIIGVRYGQKVEQANKTINYYLSPPPTKQPSPHPIQDYKMFIHSGCAISFLYPSTFTVEKNSTQEAYFTQDKIKALTFSCYPTSVTRPPVPKMWSQQFKDQEIQINNNGFMLYHKYTKQYITINIDPKYYPLFEKSFEFLSLTPTL